MVLRLGHTRLSLDYDSGIAGELELEGDIAGEETPYHGTMQTIQWMSRSTAN